MKLLIGIDPGVKTGFAVWGQGELHLVKSAMAVEVEEYIKSRIPIHGVKVRIEDARLRRWLGDNETEVQRKKQGAGSVKRDSQRWEEFCKHHDIEYRLIAPRNNKTKLKSDKFKRYTGWAGITNQHGRDAAMLVYGG